MISLSKYGHVYQINDHYVLYHSITTKVFFISKTQATCLKNNGDINEIFSASEIRLLLEKRVFVNPNEDVNEVNINNLVALNHHQRPDVFALYLILTEECNMDCYYCSQSAYRTEKVQNNMELSTVIQTLDKFYVLETRRIKCIVLYGGEPLLNRSGVLGAINYIRNEKKDADTEIVVFTNGILLDDEYIETFKNNNVNVIVSIDGDKDINDEFRKQGKVGTFDTIASNIYKLKDNDVTFGISATIASHNISMLDDVTQYFHNEFNPISLGLNPLHYPPAERKHLGVNSDDVAKAMIMAYKTARKCGLYIEQIMRRVRPFVCSTPRLKDCPACGGMIRVLPNGDFGPCGHFMEEGVSIETKGVSFASSKIIESWNERLSCSLQGCGNCDAMALCGGGCPFNSVKNSGDLLYSNKDHRSCKQAKTILKWLLSELTVLFPENTFVEISVSDKFKLLENIDITKKTPLSEYSKYGEFKLDKQHE